MCQCHVAAAHNPEDPPNPALPAIEFIGIWDTGATQTAISQSVVDRLGLVPTGMTKVNTAAGVSDTFTYLINVGFINGVRFVGLQVSLCTLVGGADLLIGMDIIGSGDFAVTCHDGCTRMTFRAPSTKCIDFVAEHNEDQRRDLIKSRPNSARKKKRR